MTNGTQVPKPSPSPLSRALKWASRLAFAIGTAALIWGVWYRRTHPSTRAPEPFHVSTIAVNWEREPFQKWSDAEDGIEIEHPSRFDEVRGFGKFTAHAVTDGLSESDLVTFRCMAPRSVIAIAVYRAPQPLTWEQWQALARKTGPPGGTKPGIPSPLGEEFGALERTYRPTLAGKLPALEVAALGAVRFPQPGQPNIEAWRFESRFVAEGNTAIRLTAGVHQDQYQSALPGLRRTLDSFRWTPKGK